MDTTLIHLFSEIENRTRQSIRGVYYCDVTDNKVRIKRRNVAFHTLYIKAVSRVLM